MKKPNIVINNLQPMTPYRITKESSDHTFIEGDIIWVSENGDINNIHGSGWITPSECLKESLDFECVEAHDYEVLKYGNSEVCRIKEVEKDFDD